MGNVGEPPGGQTVAGCHTIPSPELGKPSTLQPESCEYGLCHFAHQLGTPLRWPRTIRFHGRRANGSK